MGSGGGAPGADNKPHGLIPRLFPQNAGRRQEVFYLDETPGWVPVRLLSGGILSHAAFPKNPKIPLLRQIFISAGKLVRISGMTFLDNLKAELNAYMERDPRRARVGGGGVLLSGVARGLAAPDEPSPLGVGMEMAGASAFAHRAVSDRH